MHEPTKDIAPAPGVLPDQERCGSWRGGPIDWKVAARVVAWTLLLSLLFIAACPRDASNVPQGAGVRPPAVAGQFYPEARTRLEAAVKVFITDAVPSRGERPLALVVPHAGYAYSGQIAADGFRQVLGQSYDLVVILGTNHTSPGFRGVSVYARGGFRTPLGVAEIDSQAAALLLAADPDARFDISVHEHEHSVEVQVPFVQIALPGVKILPAVVGSEDPEICARFGKALAGVLAKRHALVVASSDLSHYPSYEDAVVSDRAVLSAITRLDPAAVREAIAAQMRAGHRELVTCACGEAPVLAALYAARSLGATRGTVLSAANSGDTPLGDRSRVVGYGAVMCTAGPPGADVSALERGENASGAPLGAAEKKALLVLARRSIDRFLTTDTTLLARGFPPALWRKQGAFVTLFEKGELRGCIGHLEEDEPLGQVVGAMALHAAVNDPRFTPLTSSELPRVEIEISVLTPLQHVHDPEAIVIGKDGVEIRKSGRSAVFLPQVPVEQGWDRTALLLHLCEKAGLPDDAWRRGAEFYTFQSVIFRESEFR